MNTDTNQLANLKAILKQAQENLKQCNYAYKGLCTFRGNDGWITISTEQLQQAATALREHANDLVEFVVNLRRFPGKTLLC